jgi:hypothetical protein
MKKVKWTLVAAAGLSLLGVAGWALAGVPAGKETVSINLVGGDKSPVSLPHAKHVDQFKKAAGKAIVCKDCHHTLKTDMGQGETPAGCETCHVKEGEKQKTIDGKTAPFLAVMKAGKPEINSVIFHQKCKDGCHKQMKAEGKNITGCKTCHAK